MAWTPLTTNSNTNTGGYTSGAITLPSSAVEEFTPVIEFVGPNANREKRYCVFIATASAITGTNADIALYGADSIGGTKYLLLDAVVADVTNAAKTKIAIIDLNAYPAPYYYLGHTADADEDANTLTYKLFFA